MDNHATPKLTVITFFLIRFCALCCYNLFGWLDHFMNAQKWTVCTIKHVPWNRIACGLVRSVKREPPICECECVCVCYLRLSVFRVSESLLGRVCVLRLLALAVCTDGVHKADGARGVCVITAVHLGKKNTRDESHVTARLQRRVWCLISPPRTLNLMYTQ